MHVSLDDVFELAKLGRTYVIEQRKQNVAQWLGHLPSEDELDTLQGELEDVPALQHLLPATDM